MNIKLQSPIPATIDTVRKTDGTRTRASAEDRDADGRRERPTAPEKNNLNDQEFDDALKILGETPGLKANGLTLRTEIENDRRVVYIVAPDGAVVRRLTEGQLWLATRDKERPTGQMLNRKI